MIEPEKVRHALHLDSDMVTDDELELFMASAQNHLKSAIGTDCDEFYDDDVLPSEFNLAVIMLVDHYNKTRSATSEKRLEQVPYGVNSIILQLKPQYRIFKQKLGGDADGNLGNGEIDA